jgi:hypothetical protein
MTIEFTPYTIEERRGIDSLSQDPKCQEIARRIEQRIGLPAGTVKVFPD